jgi:hypothetical protein
VDERQCRDEGEQLEHAGENGTHGGAQNLSGKIRARTR